MKFRAPLSLFIFCAVTLVMACGARAQEGVGEFSYSYMDQYRYGSLYDAHTAHTVGRDLQSVFGPRSGSIRYDARMIHAAQIAQERAHAHSWGACWRYVKTALLAANVIPSRPTTEYAKEAGDELQGKFGFTRIRVESPFDAPVGAVLVYGGRGAGHVEIRTATGFVSDFVSVKPSQRPLLGVYVKRS